ncbi:MAG: DNA repair exonuclease [Waddliaceae bacterium]
MEKNIIFLNLITKIIMFKFIHTADIHLDSPLKTLALRDSQIAELVGGATRRSFEKIIDLCLTEQVNALIIAGDLYDGEQRSMKTAAFLVEQMRRLEGAGIRVFMIRGNHDSESRITQHLEFPKNVRIFTGNGGVEELRDLGVAIHGVSYAERHAPESLLCKYKSPIQGLINIGILHTSLTGAKNHDNYSPCSLSDLIGHGFNYWALGHIHQRRVYSDTFPCIVMPGIPQGRDIGEEGPKSVTIVEISDKHMQIDERFVADTEFQRVQVDLSNAREWQQALELLRSDLGSRQKYVKASNLICRITLVGCSPLYWRLYRDFDLFEAQVKQIMQEFDGLFLDDIKIDMEELASTADSMDPTIELGGYMKDVMMNDAFRAKAFSFFEKAVRQLPQNLRNDYGVDKAGQEDVIQRLIAEGITNVIASLKGSGTESEVI